MAQHIFADCNRVIFLKLDIGQTQYLKARERLVLLYIGICRACLTNIKPTIGIITSARWAKWRPANVIGQRWTNNTANKMSTLVQQMTALSFSMPLEIHMHIQYVRRWVKVDNFALLTTRLCWQSDMAKQRLNTNNTNALKVDLLSPYI